MVAWIYEISLRLLNSISAANEGSKVFYRKTRNKTEMTRQYPTSFSRKNHCLVIIIFPLRVNTLIVEQFYL